MNSTSNHNNKTSIGICCFTLNCNNFSALHQSIRESFALRNIKYDNININNINNITIPKLNKYNNMIKFLLVRRRHSLNYIDFIRGKYEFNINNINNNINNNNNNLLKMFNYMSKEEVINIKLMTFDNMWNKLWNKTSHSFKYNNEFKNSKKKYNIIKKNGILENLLKICTPFETTEWEIPKGRKEENEENIDCAIREFTEETSIEKKDYTILTNIEPIDDIFIGTNNKIYKHIFYIAMANKIDLKYTQNNEIDMVKWCSLEEIITLIRPYNESKIKIITNIFLHIINTIEIIDTNDLKDCLQY